MPTPENDKNQTEAVAVFDDGESLQAAIDALLSEGFAQRDLSLLAGEDTVEKKLGHAYERVSAFEDDLSIPRTAYISPESRGDAEGAVIGVLVYVGAVAAAGAVVASGGALATAIAAAAAMGGAGGLIGSTLARLVEEHHARYLQDQIDRGGLLLWVRTWDKDRERKAVEILNRHSAHDVHVHSFTL